MIEQKIADACGRIRSRDEAVDVMLRAVADEREACAQIAESFKPGFCATDQDLALHNLAESIAAAIRQ